jgi:hypothetical protein
MPDAGRAGIIHHGSYPPTSRRLTRCRLPSIRRLNLIHGKRQLSMKTRLRRRGGRQLSVNGLATDLDTEHGGTDANKRDEARQLGRLNVAGLQL